MDLSIITSCTNRKAVTAIRQPTLEDFRSGKQHIQNKAVELAEYAMPAGRLYTGEQHIRLMNAVRQARLRGHSVTVHIVSAGYGVVTEDTPLVPYEATFNDMSRKDAMAWADELDIPQQLSAVLSRKADRTLVLLSDRYLEVARLDRITETGAPTWALCGKSSAARLGTAISPIVLDQSDTKHFGALMVSLKGPVAAEIVDNPHLSPEDAVFRARQRIHARAVQCELFEALAA